VSLPVSELHTTDLTDSCPQRVLLRWEGKLLPHAPTALVRGMVAGSACRYMHESMAWDKEDAPDYAMDYAWKQTMQDLEEDQRILTEAVEKNKDAMLKEIRNVLDQYIARLGPLFAKSEFVGCETPCTMTLDGVKFASHTDLIVRDSGNVFGYGKGRLIIFDWKWRQESPSRAYLARNLQFATYWLMARQGEFLIEDWAGYTPLPDADNAQLVWLHLPNLKPYTRKTITYNDNQEQHEYKKGDVRPLRSILKTTQYTDTDTTHIERALTRRVKMYKAGFFPATPEPNKCSLCEAESFCPRFDTTPLEGDANG
jgi:hypothetical protein